MDKPDQNKEEKMDLSNEIIPKYNSKTNKRLYGIKELDNFYNKKNFRSTLYSQRARVPMNSDIHSYFHDNNQGDSLQKKYLFIISKYEKIVEELSNINKKLEENNNKIEELNNFIKKLKEDKKQKQSDIVNYLSNKESLEEIYKNKINYLIISKKDSKSKSDSNEINLNLDSLKNNNSNDIDNYNMDEEKPIEIKIEDIKRSDKNKFNEQVISFAEEILDKKGNEELINKIKSKINIAYNIFFSEISSNSQLNLESIVSNFFSRIALYISNNSLGNYSEVNINKFLRYILKINSVNIEISQILKFLNKKYKEQKTEARNKIIILKKRNENLKERKLNYEKKSDDYEKIIEKNKEYINNIKSNLNKNDEKIEKRKYMNHTLDRLYFRKGANNLKLLTDENLKSQRGHIKTGINNNNDDFDNLKTEDNIELYKNKTNKSEKNKKKKIINDNNDEQDNGMNKSNEGIIGENKNEGKKSKSIIITKNTKIILKKTGKQYKIKNYKKDKDNNTNNYENIETEVNNNLDSDKNKNNNNSINQNYIVIKNGINLKNNNVLKEKNKTDLISNNIKIKNSSNSVNNNIVKKTKPNNTHDKIIINENNNIEENEKNLLYNKKSFNQQKAKYNKNIYIINNISNSENIQTKNNIYDNKTQNININTGGNINFDNFKEFDRKNRNINYTNITENINEKTFMGNNKNNQENENKNKTNYNFHDILNVNTIKNNRSFLLTNLDSNKNDKSFKLENIVTSPTSSYKNLENKKQRIFQKNSYDYKTANNKGYNISKVPILYKKYGNVNVLKKSNNTKSLSIVNTNKNNNSIKISVYSKKKDK